MHLFTCESHLSDVSACLMIGYTYTIKLCGAPPLDSNCKATIATAAAAVADNEVFLGGSAPFWAILGKSWTILDPTI